MNKVIYIIRLKGKARQVFDQFSGLVKEIGNKTLGELAKELK